MTNAIIAALSEFPAGAVKSITCTASSIPQAETFPEFPLPPKKKPGVDQRQAKKSSLVSKNSGFVSSFSQKLLHLV